MIVRRKFKKAVPATEYQFRVSLEKKDVKTTLWKYTQNLLEKAPELADGYIYTIEELTTIFTNRVVEFVSGCAETNQSGSKNKSKLFHVVISR